MSKLSDFLGGAGGSGFGSLPVQIVSTDTTVEPNTSVGINTFDGEVTVTMPANPKAGDMLVFFDIGLSWNVHPPVVDRNGNIVNGYSGDQDTFTLNNRGGLLTLIFSGSGTGWMDMSYIFTGTESRWMELGREEYIISLDSFKAGREFVRIEYLTSSGRVDIQEEGWYVITACGAGSYNSSGNVRKGGDTIVTVNDEILFEALAAGPVTTTSAKVYGTTLCAPTIGEPYVIRTHVGEKVVTDLSVSSALGVARLTSRGGRYGSGSSNFGDAFSSSVLIRLAAGDYVHVSIGAKATYDTEDGEASIHHLK